MRKPGVDVVNASHRYAEEILMKEGDALWERASAMFGNAAYDITFFSHEYVRLMAGYELVGRVVYDGYRVSALALHDFAESKSITPDTGTDRPLYSLNTARVQVEAMMRVVVEHDDSKLSRWFDRTPYREAAEEEFAGYYRLLRDRPEMIPYLNEGFTNIELIERFLLDGVDASIAAGLDQG